MALDCHNSEKGSCFDVAMRFEKSLFHRKKLTFWDKRWSILAQRQQSSVLFHMNKNSLAVWDGLQGDMTAPIFMMARSATVPRMDFSANRQTTSPFLSPRAYSAQASWSTLVFRHPKEISSAVASSVWNRGQTQSKHTQQGQIDDGQNFQCSTFSTCFLEWAHTKVCHRYLRLLFSLRDFRFLQTRNPPDLFLANPRRFLCSSGWTLHMYNQKVQCFCDSGSFL